MENALFQAVSSVACVCASADGHSLSASLLFQAFPPLCPSVPPGWAQNRSTTLAVQCSLPHQSLQILPCAELPLTRKFLLNILGLNGEEWELGAEPKICDVT